MKATALIFTLLFLAIAPLHAGNGALSLSPAVVTLRGELGAGTTQTLTIVNGTSQSAAFDIEAQDVSMRDGSRVFVRAGELPGSIAATAVFSQRQVMVAPGQSASVTVTMTLPQNTAQRAVVVLFKGTKKMVSNGVPVMASLGSLVTFTVSDRIELTAAPAVVKPQTDAANLSVSQSCANTGTEPLVARGVLAILDNRGSLVGRAELPPRRILPAERTTLTGEYPGELAAGHYKLLVTYEYEGHSLTSSSETDIQ